METHTLLAVGLSPKAKQYCYELLEKQRLYKKWFKQGSITRDRYVRLMEDTDTTLLAVRTGRTKVV